MALEEFDELAHAGSMIELLPHNALRCLAKLQAKLGLDDEPPQGFAESFGIFGFDNEAVLFIAKQLGNARNIGGQADKSLARRLHQNIRQAVRIAILRNPAGERDNIRLPVSFQHSLLRLRSLPANAVSDAQRCGKGSQSVELLATTDMGEAPGELARQQGQRPKEHVIAFLL